MGMPCNMQTPEVVLLALQRNGWALKHANEVLKNNPEVVLLAVQQKPALDRIPQGPGAKSKDRRTRGELCSAVDTETH